MVADMSQSMSRLADMPLTTMPGAGQASELAVTAARKSPARSAFDHQQKQYSTLIRFDDFGAWHYGDSALDFHARNGSARGAAALGDAVRLVGDDGRGGMSMMQVMVSGIN